MPDGEEFFVDIIGLGHDVDILPLAQEVIAKCPFTHDLSPLELAELTARMARGKYIPVDIQDRVEGRKLDLMTGAVIKWVQSAYRIEQIRDLLVYFPDKRIELSVEAGCCKGARAKSRRFVPESELERLPMPECWRTCFCQYTTSNPKKRSKSKLTR